MSAMKQPVWPRFLPTAWVVSCATLGPVGRIRRAPGTWGSVAGLLYFITVFADRIGNVGLVLFSLAGLYFAAAICGEAEFRLGERDPGKVVLDEFVAMPLCFIGWERLKAGDAMPTWAIFLTGFALFRLFDITKPFGIKKLQDLPGGWGVAIDDTAAALAACATLHAAHLAWMHWGA
ncbi:MAG: phosphatidylglycerophosphatase [Rariglobus sp.]|jgi:phosphatidylglycerophosphatase A|nr:phosphatidylglycerophosphatase [Rariglobus sp.]